MRCVIWLAPIARRCTETEAVVAHSLLVGCNASKGSGPSPLAGQVGVRGYHWDGCYSPLSKGYFFGV
jgi:hypothetical protein